MKPGDVTFCTACFFAQDEQPPWVKPEARRNAVLKVASENGDGPPSETGLAGCAYEPLPTPRVIRRNRMNDWILEVISGKLFRFFGTDLKKFRTPSAFFPAYVIDSNRNR